MHCKTAARLGLFAAVTVFGLLSAGAAGAGVASKVEGESLLAADPANAQAYQDFAAFYFALGNPVAAADVLERGKVRADVTAGLLVDLGRAYQLQKQWNKAETTTREAIATPQYSAKLPVVSVRALNNHAMTHFGELQLDLLERLKNGTINRTDAQYKVEEYWVGSLRNAAVDGDVEHGSLMAGQSVGMMSRGQPLRDILQELVDEADQAVDEVSRRLQGS
jgi:enoyl-[acyl-carrier protein] reductase II